MTEQMEILVFGRTGQLARELARQATDSPHDLTFLGRDQADLTQPERCAAAIRARRPSAVINAAAYTAVDTAEENEAAARVVNGDSPGAMARACAEAAIPIVHVSTDYVFDGTGTAPFAPDAPTSPLGAYGRTKLAGEDAMRRAGGAYAILRTSWVFSAHGANFVKTMLRLSETRDALSIVNDQIGGPTAAADIARTCLDMAAQLAADPGKGGIYHFSGTPDVSWKDFAEAIFAAAGRRVTVTGIPTADYPTPAARPLNSRLDCTTTEATFGIPRPDWRMSLTHVLQDLQAEA